MAIDTVSVFNRALDLVGARSNISLPDENSREAEACRLHFEFVRDQILASAAWPEATKIRSLSLLSADDEDGVWETGEPRPGYLYAYALPTDAVRPQYLITGQRFQLATNDDSIRVLMTSSTPADLVYTFRQELVSQWSPELQGAITYALAASICGTLTGKPSRAKLLAEQANQHILVARETAANTNDEMLDSLPDWIAARGYNDTSSRARYTYPFGSMLMVSNVN